MSSQERSPSVVGLATPLIADAAVRLGIELRAAPPGVRPNTSGGLFAGPARPVRHSGSVDVFLAALETTHPGDVLVVDNGGQLDHGCLGDLVVLEAEVAGVVAIVVWGAHRDTMALRPLAPSVFSYGRASFGPTKAEPWDAGSFERACFDDFGVTREDFVFADDDGVLFAAQETVSDLVAAAAEIDRVEREQMERVRAGTNLRQQLDFDVYMRRREADAAYTFREHLKMIDGAIET